MDLSICMITKNEWKKLERCISKLVSWNVEIVVVDTGSTDRTKEMLQNYPCKVYDFTWINDFAAAKNYAISMASNDRVLVFDSDEYIESCDVEALGKQVQDNKDKVGRITIRNRVPQDGEVIETLTLSNRLFDRREFCFEGRIHEQVVRIDGGKYETYRTNITVFHDGYNGTSEERKKKSERNIRLLMEELENDKENTYLLYQIGKAYYLCQEYENALVYFDKALALDVEPTLDYVADMVETFGYTLLNLGQKENALMLEGVYDAFSYSADFQFLMGLIYMNNGLFEEAVAEFLKAAEKPGAKAVGANSYLAYYNAGVIRECLGDLAQAREFYIKCGNYEKAKKRLQEIGQEA